MLPDPTTHGARPIGKLTSRRPARGGLARLPALALALAAASAGAAAGGCRKSRPEGQAGRKAPSPRPPASLLAASAEASASKPAGAPLTAEEVYPQAVRCFAEASAAKSPAARRQILAEAAKRVPLWYAHLAVPAPDTTRLDWLTVVLWDTMPEEEYHKALENSRDLFQEYGKPFPAGASRREFMKALEELPKDSKESDGSTPEAPASTRP